MKKYSIAGRELTLCSEPPPKGLAAFASMFGIKSFTELGTNAQVQGEMGLHVVDLQIDQDKLNKFLALATDCKDGINIDAIDDPQVLSEIVFDFFQVVVAKQFSRVSIAHSLKSITTDKVN